MVDVVCYEVLNLRIKDRHDREFALGPTRKVVTDIIRNDISSYKALPINVYQIQTKFRDERPRFGLMRGREFLMKDAYSFHTSQECLDKEFNNMKDTYSRIFLKDVVALFRPVEADSGAIGGSGSQEFHVLAQSGEDEIIYSDAYDYAANVETAKSKLVELERRS